MTTFPATAFDVGLEWSASAGTSPELLLIPCLLRPVVFAFGEIAGLAMQFAETRAIVFLAALIVATVTDLRHGRIYNWLTLPLMLFALTHAAFSECNSAAVFPTDEPAGELNQAIMGGLVCFGLMFLYYATSGGGGGDVKLATAVGFGFGAEAGLHVIAMAYFMGWLVDKVICLVLGSAKRLRSMSDGETSDVCRGKREIRMAPWFLLAILPVLAGRPLF